MGFTFTNKDNLPPRSQAPEGDYKFTVVGAATSLINKGNYTGTSKWELELALEGHPEFWNPPADLTEHPDFAWQFDTFCKCCGVQIAENEEVEVNGATARERKVRWINVVGLRGVCGVRHTKSKTDATKTYTRVTFYTDREKLAPNAALQARHAASVGMADEENNPF